MARILFLLVAVLVVLGDGGSVLAAKKKKNEPPAPIKAIYEAPMTVAIVRNGDPACEPNCPEWIAAEGEITGSTPSKFAQVFKRMGNKKFPIIIRSPGGSIDAAINIGRMIRKRKLDVAVGFTQFEGCAPNQKNCKLPKEQKGIYRGKVFTHYSFCNSACPMILAAGTVRLASIDTSVGVHKPKIVSWQERVFYRESYRMVNGKKKVLKRTVTGRKRVNNRVSYEFGKSLRKKLAAYYREMGVDAAIMDDSEKAAFKEMEILRGDRLDALKLRTSSKSADTLADSIICKRAPAASNCIVSALNPLPAGKANDEAVTARLVRREDAECKLSCPWWISIEGEVSQQTVVQFEEALKTSGMRKLPVFLNSTGGDLWSALKIGGLIHRYKLDAAVARTVMRDCTNSRGNCNPEKVKIGLRGKVENDGTCHGACLLVFAAGESRMAHDSASLNVTRPAKMAPAMLEMVASQMVSNYLSSLSFRWEFAQIFYGAPENGSVSLDSIQRSRLGLVNRKWKPDELVGGGLCASGAPADNCLSLR